MVERVMMGENVVSAGQAKAGWGVNGAAPLVFHELTHSFGYAHDGLDAEVGSKPNNIPYFVQIILGYQADDILNAYCGGSVPNCTRSYQQGSPNSMLTEFFGPDP
jgi:hypothetical protein